MKNFMKVAGLVGVLALTASPALALPSPAPDNPGTAHAPATTPPANEGTANKPASPASDASAQSKGRAYGKYCANQSRKHVAGTPGTPFSKCVTAMAKVVKNNANPTTACKTLSKKHVKGQKGTPFSKCVSAAARLQNDDKPDSEATTPPATS